MSLGDYIRSMSDEELADFFARLLYTRDKAMLQKLFEAVKYTTLTQDMDKMRRDQLELLKGEIPYKET